MTTAEPTLAEFMEADSATIAAQMRARGFDTMVVWLNGTRRWYIVEHGLAQDGPDVEPKDYVELGVERIVEGCALVFAHGIETLILPGIVAPNLARGGGYVDDIFVPLVERVIESPRVRQAIDEIGVALYVYGRLRDFLPERHRGLVDDLEAFARSTQTGAATRRLFLGMCPDDAATAASRVCAEFHAAHGRFPDRREIISAYYGAFIERIHVVVGYGRYSVHSTPFFNFGEDLYFMAAPSPYFDQQVLRRVLYDKLVARRIDDDQYGEVSEAQWYALRSHFRRHRHKVVGVGVRDPARKFWFPAPALDFDDQEWAALVDESTAGPEVIRPQVEG